MTPTERELHVARLRFRMTQSEADAQLCEKLYKELQEEKLYIAPAKGAIKVERLE